MELIPEVKVVLKRAKEFKWQIVRDLMDKEALMVTTDVGSRIEHISYLDFKNTRIDIWKITGKNGEVKYGTYKEVIPFFIKDYIAARRVITL